MRIPNLTSRRRFFQTLGSGALALHATAAPSGRPLRGIFPIAQTPFLESGGLDIDTLVRQLEFLHRGGVHGCVWPQLASEWSALTEEERRSGAEALVKAGRKWKPAVVIGVQAADASAAVRYAEHAASIGADAIIALPPPGQPSQDAVLAYYKQIGQATPLPLFVQAVGNMNVDFILKLWKSVPTLKLIKDEAGEPLMRVGRLRAESQDDIKVFTGAHGRTLIDEMYRGTSGTMPAASFADIYASVWDLWQEGKRKEAMDLFGKALLFITEVQVYGIASLKYLLELRGVFRNHSVRRPAQGSAAASMLAAGGLEVRAELDAKAKEILAQMVDYAKPYFRA
jgi:4-hydroxy-tetrahydrodipicolinate synthase